MSERDNLPEERAAAVVRQMGTEGFLLGLRTYIATVRRVGLVRSRLMEKAEPDEAPRCLSASFKCFVTGIFISYFLYLPTVWNVEPKTTKWLFLAVFLFSQILTGFLVHLTLKIVGGKATLRDTAGVYLTWTGIIYPILFALRYPFLIYVSVRVAATGAPLIDRERELWISWTSAAVIVFLASCYIPLRWLSWVHRISVKRELLGLAVIYFPLMFLNYFLLPYERQWTRVIGELIEQLM